MSVTTYWTLSVSLMGVIVALGVFAARQQHMRLLAATLLLSLAYVVWYSTPFPFDTRNGDGNQDVAAVAICYIAMLLGMVAEYVYAQGEEGEHRLALTPMTFVMPILASPIVFIPLLTIAGDINAPGILSRAKLMVYFVAFQNGFFWKSFFEQRRRVMITEGVRP